jgi:hypothetical protein
MKAFRILLVMMIIGILSYTGIAGYNHGWDLLPVFFGDMTAMTWSGQLISFSHVIWHYRTMCLLEKYFNTQQMFWVYSGLWRG